MCDVRAHTNTHQIDECKECEREHTIQIHTVFKVNFTQAMRCINEGKHTVHEKRERATNRRIERDRNRERVCVCLRERAFR